MQAAYVADYEYPPNGSHPKTAGLVHRWIQRQIAWSEWFDSQIPAIFQLDGNRDFLDRVAPEQLRTGETVWDVGGGKNPTIPCDRKRKMALHITGLDIDAEELAAAPAGSYDAKISGDITRFRGNGDADLIVCQALLEHLPEPDAAMAAITSILKPGGKALIFVPSRNAVFARLNLLLPQSLKRRLLFSIFPGMSRDHGFPAYYRGCTPNELRQLAERHGLICRQEFLYFRSDYFRFCFPLHVLWRLWIALFRFVAPRQAAETFTLVLESEGKQ
jgi:SAM-dependent methyltransferase